MKKTIGITVSPRFPIFALLVGLVCLQPCLEAVLPLRDQWRSACRALAGGDSSRALSLFREFDHWYGQEPEVADPEFHEKRLRLWGIAALQAGDLTEATPLLETWLTENTASIRFRAFIRFQLANAYRALENSERAIAHWERFTVEHPHIPECALVHWAWAEALLAQSDFSGARRHLEAALNHPRLPDSGRALVETALALIDLSQGQIESAHRWLRNSDAPTDVHRLWRAILAPSLAKRFLMEDRADNAVEVVQWFDRPENLAKKLHVMLQASKAAPPGPRQEVWNNHWSGQANRLEAAVSQSAESVDLEASLFALRLQAFLGKKDAARAIVLSTALLRSENPLAEALRATAYAGAIESCHLRRDWTQAEELATAFLEAFPEHPDLPEILFLQARTAAGRNDVELAIAKADQLQGLFPGHRSRNGWRVAAAGWRLNAGRTSEALEQFVALESESTEAWLPFLRVQQARCHEQLAQFEEATRLFQSVAAVSSALASIKEQAAVGLLKIQLRLGAQPDFLKTLASYRAEFPNGQSRILVENIAGSFYQQTGEIDKAIAVYAAVVQEPHPAARFAYEQLSHIFRGLSDYSALQALASASIRRSLDSGIQIPDAPFQDLQLVQQGFNTSALPEDLLQSLLDAVDSDDCPLSGITFFTVLEDQWRIYRSLLGTDTVPFEEWVDLRARRHHAASAWRPYATCQLFAAHFLDRLGRTDSADARRIEILQAVDPQFLNEEGFHAIAATAQDYDFAEASRLMQAFLQRFPESKHRPETLYRLAKTRRLSPQREQAVALLQEVQREWPDSAIFNVACLQLADWYVQDRLPGKANAVLEVLLNRTHLPPDLAASGLLLRSKADLLAGNTGRSWINCQRILQLYPAFHDISTEAAHILMNSRDQMDASTRTAVRSLIQGALPEFTFPEDGDSHA